MAQHQFPDIVVDDPDGRALAVILNNLWATLISTHSGATRPSYLSAGGMWVRDVSGTLTLMLYDGSNDIPIGMGTAFDAVNLDTLYLAGQYFGYGGAHASATAGDNPFPDLDGSFGLLVGNSNEGTASQYIWQKAVQLDQGVPVWKTRTKTTDGNGWGRWYGATDSLIQIYDVTDQADVIIPVDLAGFDHALIRCENVIFENSGDHLAGRTSTDGGANKDSGPSDYSWDFGGTNDGTGIGQFDASDSKMQFTRGAGNTLIRSISGEIFVFNPGSAERTQITTVMRHRDTTGGMVTVHGGGRREADAAFDAIQLYASTGNISGKFYLYGRN